MTPAGPFQLFPATLPSAAPGDLGQSVRPPCSSRTPCEMLINISPLQATGLNAGLALLLYGRLDHGYELHVVDKVGAEVELDSGLLECGRAHDLLTSSAAALVRSCGTQTFLDNVQVAL
ncbi:hypothetical protein T492DRAFT_1143326 [Pavlovales sp. CCMP2436]|nr:hypothetical protein T492DRAFT_1143326 [Pavlovales sp. CCMP2436]